MITPEVSRLLAALRELANPNNYDCSTDDQGEVVDWFVWMGDKSDTCLHPWNYAALVYQELLADTGPEIHKPDTRYTVSGPYTSGTAQQGPPIDVEREDFQVGPL